MDQHKIGKKAYVLVTIHRAENTDDRERLSNILDTLRIISQELAVILPLHPRTRKMIHHFAIEDHLKGLVVTEPLGFLDMMLLEKNARVIVTDSGGVQKEAYFHRVPCVTLRDETEWVETIETRWNILANVNTVRGITEAIRTSLTLSDARPEINEYGDGQASQKIVRLLERYFNDGDEAKTRGILHA